MSPPPRGKSGGDITKSGGDTPKFFARAMRAQIPPRYVPLTFKMPPAPLLCGHPMGRGPPVEDP